MPDSCSSMHPNTFFKVPASSTPIYSCYRVASTGVQAVVNEMNRKHKAGEIGEEDMQAIHVPMFWTFPILNVPQIYISMSLKQHTKKKKHNLPIIFINQWPGGKPWKDSDTDSSDGGSSDERVATPAAATANPVTTTPTPAPTVSPSKPYPAASDASVASVASGWVQQPFFETLESLESGYFLSLPNSTNYQMITVLSWNMPHLRPVGSGQSHDKALGGSSAEEGQAHRATWQVVAIQNRSFYFHNVGNYF